MPAGPARGAPRTRRYREARLLALPFACFFALLLALASRLTDVLRCSAPPGPIAPTTARKPRLRRARRVAELSFSERTAVEPAGTLSVWVGATSLLPRSAYRAVMHGPGARGAADHAAQARAAAVDADRLDAHLRPGDLACAAGDDAGSWGKGLGRRGGGGRRAGGRACARDAGNAARKAREAAAEERNAAGKAGQAARAGAAARGTERGAQRAEDGRELRRNPGSEGELLQQRPDATVGAPPLVSSATRASTAARCSGGSCALT